jgi:RNA polymerase sigma-70 factor (ECF subfamily)
MLPASPSPHFATTRWSVVLATQREDAREALETLCRAYWYPLYAYTRRAGHDVEEAKDLTQAFFAAMLEKDWLQVAAPERGRFRSFLLTMLKRFLINEWHKNASMKRGGNITHVPLDAEDAERRFATEPEMSPDAMFERRWAMTLLDQTLAALEEEFTAAGKQEAFQAMKHCLTLDRDHIPYAELAARTGFSEGAARVAVHRLRKRFREVFRESITATLADGEDVETEMRHVVAVLGVSS